MHRFGSQILLSNITKQTVKHGWNSHCRCLYAKFKKLYFHRTISYNNSNDDKHVIHSPYKTIHVPRMNLPELIWSRTNQHSDFVAIECGISGRKYSYAQLQKLSKRFAVSLLKAGFRPGEYVVTVCPNCPEFPIICLGTLEAGLIFTPIDHLSTTDDLYFQLNKLQMACIITASEQLNNITCVVNKLKENKNQVNVKIISMDIGQESNTIIPPEVESFSNLVSDQIDENSFSNTEIEPKSVAVCIHSSGTTGLPKAVQLTHRNFVSALFLLSAPEVNFQSEATDSYQEIIPCLIPFNHIYGFVVTMMLSLFHGSKMVAIPKFEEQSYLKILLNHKCSILHLVPPIMSFLGKNSVVKKEMLQHVKYLCYTAAPVQKSDLESCLQKIDKGSELVSLQAYASTKTISICQPRHNCTNVNSIGAPLPNTSIKVVDPTTGESLGPRQDGEICVKGPQVMEGHCNTLVYVLPLDSDGWLHTGDIGHYDEDFNFFIVGRIKELIKVKGFQVSPIELEDILRTHSAVCDVAVFGVPNNKYGEVPVAYVVKSPSDSTLISDLKEFIATKVPKHKNLHDIVFVDKIQKSSMGKILRKDMMKQYISEPIN